MRQNCTFASSRFSICISSPGRSPADEYSLNRIPQWAFYVSRSLDRFHSYGHSECGDAYNALPDWAKNTSMVEQLNGRLAFLKRAVLGMTLEHAAFEVLFHIMRWADEREEQLRQRGCPLPSKGPFVAGVVPSSTPAEPAVGITPNIVLNPNLGRDAPRTVGKAVPGTGPKRRKSSPNPQNAEPKHQTPARHTTSPSLRIVAAAATINPVLLPMLPWRAMSCYFDAVIMCLYASVQY